MDRGPRFGAGSIPSCRSTFATVPRATLCPDCSKHLEFAYPGWIFTGETENETTECLRGPGPTGRALTRAVIFPRDQAPVPPEQSFRSNDWNDFAQRVDASEFRFGCEPDALTIGKARLPSELFPKDFDLLQQVIYQELLVSINLAG